MEKRKDHFSDWQLPSQTSFNKRGEKTALKGQPAASLRHGRDPGALQPLQGSGWVEAVTPSMSPWGPEAARVLSGLGAVGP